MARLEGDRGAKLGQRVGDAVDARVDRPERIARVGPLRQLAAATTAELAGGALQVAVSRARGRASNGPRMFSGCRAGRALERRDRAGVLPLPGAGDAEIELRDRDVGLAGDDLLEQRYRAREGAIFDGENGVVQRVGDGDAILGIRAGRLSARRRIPTRSLAR